MRAIAHLRYNRDAIRKIERERGSLHGVAKRARPLVVLGWRRKIYIYVYIYLEKRALERDPASHFADDDVTAENVKRLVATAPHRQVTSLSRGIRPEPRRREGWQGSRSTDYRCIPSASSRFSYDASPLSLSLSLPRSLFSSVLRSLSLFATKPGSLVFVLCSNKGVVCDGCAKNVARCALLGAR